MTQASSYYDRGVFHESRVRMITFYTSQYTWCPGPECFESPRLLRLHQGEWKTLDVPDDMPHGLQIA